MKDSRSHNDCRITSIQLTPSPIDARRNYIEHICSIMIENRFGRGWFAEPWEDDDDHLLKADIHLDLMPSPASGVELSGVSVMRRCAPRHIQTAGHIVFAASLAVDRSPNTQPRGSPGMWFHAKTAKDAKETQKCVTAPPKRALGHIQARDDLGQHSSPSRSLGHIDQGQYRER